MNIALVLTKEQNIIPQTEKRYLGPWCLDYNLPVDEIRLLEHSVLPDPFAQPKNAEQIYPYLKKIDAALFPQLCGQLNSMHSVNHSLRYWRIVLGYWWIEFIENAYARYMTLKTATDLVQNADVYIFDPLHTTITPYDTVDYIALSEYDYYNHYILSKMIYFLNSFTINIINLADFTLTNFPSLPALRNHHTNSLKKISCYLSRWNNIYFSSTYIQKPALLKIACQLMQFPIIAESPRFIFARERSIDKENRKSVTMTTQDEFEALIAFLLPESIPRIYIEDFNKLKRTAQRYFPKRKTKCVLTSAGYASNEGFKVFAATQTEKYKTPYIITQHGGCYGSSEWHLGEEYEKEVADYYLTYGWQEQNNPKVIPYIANRFKEYNKTVTGQQRGQIIWVLNVSSRYPRMHLSNREGPPFVNYLNEQVSFLLSLSPDIRQYIEVRPYQLDKGWNVIHYLEQRAFPLSYSRKRISLAAAAKKSRLVVCTTNSSAHLEMFALNIPVLLYWNAKDSPLRSAAIPIHQKLQDLGILHHDPIKAGHFLNEIADHTQAWWQQPAIQEVRNEFCALYAATSPNYAKKWKNMIKQLSHK